MAPKASVVVRCKDEARYIGRVLEQVCAQDCVDTELVVVDSGSTDGTLDIVSKFPARVVTIPPESFTYGYSSNVGARTARGEYVVYLSAHSVPASRDWLRALLEPFADPRVAGVYGRQVPHPGCRPLEARMIAETFGPEPRLQTEDPFFSTANAAIRRERWLEAPFDETLPASEDRAWAQVEQGKGYMIAYAPEAEVYHSHNESLLGQYRRAYLETRGRALAAPVGRASLASSARAWIFGTWDDLRYLLRAQQDPRWLAYAPLSNLMRALGAHRGIAAASASAPVRIAPAPTTAAKSHDR